MTLLAALAGANFSRPPVWLMRQAGRYSPTYQKLRQGRGVHDLFHDEAAVEEITLIPVQELGVDAAILFSDILIVLDLLGVEYIYGPTGPSVTGRGNTRSLDFLGRAIENLRKRLTIPLIGFVGGPYTVASYGATSWMDAIEEATLEYMQLQIDAGVQVMQIFDSYVAQADDAIFARAMRFLERVRSRFSLPLIFYARKLGDRIVQIPSGYCVGVDETVAIDSVHRCVQGNLDPQTLIDGTHLHHAQRILDAMQGRSDFIFNIGRGVLPATPLSAVQELVAFVHSYEPAVV